MEIQPDKQNLDQTFSTTIYYIDFYQRDYKWNDQPVKRLLDDIFYQFEETYQSHSELDANQENITSKYPWYYLNTYVTNTVGGRVFVVDGQQRLTTLTLILLKLHSLAKKYSSENLQWIERKITGYSGPTETFWMNHVNHLGVLKDLLDDKELSEIDTSSGVTAVNMVANYEIISDQLLASLESLHKFDTFVHYFLSRLVLINLSVDSTHVPMVFEVINDRGVRLKPYEILKGKLLGQIDKEELENGEFNELWESNVGEVNSFKSDEIDSCFRYWLKAKFSGNRKDGQRFDGEYHREIFSSDVNDSLGLDHNSTAVKTFLRTEFKYFTSLYARVKTATLNPDERYPAVYYNSLNDLDMQYMLILSACKVDDPEEKEKIDLVATGLDRLFSLLQLQGAYGSNEFGLLLFTISKQIREQSASRIEDIFELHLRKEIESRRGNKPEESISYQLFRPMSIDRLNRRFIRYLFARVENLLAIGMNQAMKHGLADLMKGGNKHGFHVEHILSRNSENVLLFDGDEERFDNERNRLGGVLLLKGQDNISSGNENFANKLRSYSSTLLWNETLREDCYKSNLDFRSFCKDNNFLFRALVKFGPDELEDRHRLLFELCCHIWGNKTAN